MHVSLKATVHVCDVGREHILLGLWWERFKLPGQHRILNRDWWLKPVVSQLRKAEAGGITMNSRLAKDTEGDSVSKGIINKTETKILAQSSHHLAPSGPGSDLTLGPDEGGKRSSPGLVLIPLLPQVPSSRRTQPRTTGCSSWLYQT